MVKEKSYLWALVVVGVVAVIGLVASFASLANTSGQFRAVQYGGVTYPGVLDMLNDCTMYGRNVFPEDDPTSCDDVCGQLSCIYAGAHQIGVYNYDSYSCDYKLYDSQTGVQLDCLCCSSPS